MVHAGYAQVYNAGTIEYVSGDFNSLLFNFDVTLAGGQYQCLDIHPTESLSSGVESYLDVCYFNTNYNDRWVADLEIFFQKDDNYATTYYFGGNDVGANYGVTQIASWGTSFQTYFLPTQEAAFSGTTIYVPEGFSQVCIFCACGRNAYCTDSQQMKGTFRLRGLSTGSTATAATIQPGCTLADFDGVIPTLSPATTPEPSTATPTYTAPPTMETNKPSYFPSYQPTTLPECLEECTSTDAPTYSPAWIPPTHYPTRVKNITRSPTV